MVGGGGGWEGGEEAYLFQARLTGDLDVALFEKGCLFNWAKRIIGRKNNKKESKKQIIE